MSRCDIIFKSSVIIYKKYGCQHSLQMQFLEKKLAQTSFLSLLNDILRGRSQPSTRGCVQPQQKQKQPSHMAEAAILATMLRTCRVRATLAAHVASASTSRLVALATCAHGQVDHLGRAIASGRPVLHGSLSFLLGPSRVRAAIAAPWVLRGR